MYAPANLHFIDILPHRVSRQLFTSFFFLKKEKRRVEHAEFPAVDKN